VFDGPVAQQDSECRAQQFPAQHHQQAQELGFRITEQETVLMPKEEISFDSWQQGEMGQ
jgi:hypothetical protein